MINHLSFWDCIQVDENFNFSFVNYCEKYFSLSSTVFRVVDLKDESIQSLKKHHFIVVKDQVEQNIFINILKVISYCTIIIPIIMLVGKVLLHNSYTFIDKEKAGETSTSEQKKDFEKTPFGSSLDEWLNDPKATGNKVGAAKAISKCFQNQTEKGVPLNVNSPNGSDTLDLSGYNLNSLPSGMEIFNQLKYLNLSKNEFTTIPNSVFQLTNLEKLDLSFNKISDISKIGNLINLKQLNLHLNKISDISEIENLINLECLWVGHNNLTTIPPSIRKLTKLKCFFLECNLLTSVPKEIGNLIELVELCLCYNRLKSIPSEIQNLTNLKILNLNGNQLLDTPVIPAQQFSLENEK